MAGSVSADIEVAEFAGQLFFRLWRASHTRTAQALSSIGLTPALFALLNVLGARDGTIQQQLSSDMGIDPSAIVKLINELEEAGWPSADGARTIAAPGRS
jgi:DNA-binding MarR family transcriptional regulator